MRRNVEILLRADVPALGRVGDVVRVRAGYARNFLLPRRFALPVTPENVRRLAKAKGEREAADRAAIEAFRALAGRIGETTVTVQARVGEEGRLYGSVTARQVAEALVGEGLPVEEGMVALEHPLKERGVFSVPVVLHPEVRAEVRVWIVEEGAPAGTPPPEGVAPETPPAAPKRAKKEPAPPSAARKTKKKEKGGSEGARPESPKDRKGERRGKGETAKD